MHSRSHPVRYAFARACVCSGDQYEAQRRTGASAGRGMGRARAGRRECGLRGEGWDGVHAGGAGHGARGRTACVTGAGLDSAHVAGAKLGSARVAGAGLDSARVAGAGPEGASANGLKVPPGALAVILLPSWETMPSVRTQIMEFAVYYASDLRFDTASCHAFRQKEAVSWLCRDWRVGIIGCSNRA